MRKIKFGYIICTKFQSRADIHKISHFWFYSFQSLAVYYYIYRKEIQKQTIPYKIICCLYFKYGCYYAGASLVAQTAKNWPTTQETQTWSLSREECLEKIPCSVQATISMRMCLFSFHLRSLHFLRDLQLWHVGCLIAVCRI